MRTLVLAGLLALVIGCSPKAGETATDTLNRITDVANPAWAASVEVCDSLESQAISTAGTRMEALERIAQIHDRCDVVNAAFMALAQAQASARAAIAAFQDGDGTAADVNTAVAVVNDAWEITRSLLEELGVFEDE